MSVAPTTRATIESTIEPTMMGAPHQNKNSILPIRLDITVSLFECWLRATGRPSPAEIVVTHQPNISRFFRKLFLGSGASHKSTLVSTHYRISAFRSFFRYPISVSSWPVVALLHLRLCMSRNNRTRVVELLRICKASFWDNEGGMSVEIYQN
jgi:hypothetical protein